MTSKDTRPLIPYMRQSRKRGEATISIDEQRRDIQRWADENGVSLAAEIVEQNVSGSKPWRERELGEAIAACERGEAAGVIVAWQDRLSRENGLATAAVWDALDKADARLVCAAEGLDTAKSDDELTFSIRAAMARDKWKRAKADFARAQRSAHERGIPNGRPSLGYRKGKDKRLEIDARGAKKVRAIFAARVDGESLSDIGRRFGLSHTTVSQILENDVYVGTLRCGPGLVTENNHPAIISRDLFEAADGARTKQPVPPGDTTRNLLLVGLAYCAGCGHTLKVVRRPRVDGSYAVSYYCKDKATERCPDRAFVHADALDEYVAQWFAAALRTTPRMVDVVAAARDLEEAQKAVEKAQAQLKKYVEEIEIEDAAVFQRGVRVRETRLDEARAKVQIASTRTVRIPVGGSLISLWDTFSVAERRDVLRGFLARIDVSRGASGNLAGHISIVWADGEIADDETRVRVAAA